MLFRSAIPINHLGIRYYFSEKISLALSIAYLKNETSTSYSAAAQGTEIQWPHYGYSISDYLTISQEINSYPTLLTLYYQPPARLLGDRIHFYVGGGVGLYFSTLSTDISRNYTMDHSKGKANWPQVDISGDPLVADILSNIRAKANPFGYHVAAGLNVSYKNIFINIEFGYHLATAKFGEEDWTYFTRSFTQIKNFEGKNFNSASGQYETIYQETKKYFLEIPESAYDNLKMTKLDFSGILIKGGIGFSF